MYLFVFSTFIDTFVTNVFYSLNFSHVEMEKFSYTIPILLKLIALLSLLIHVDKISDKIVL